MVMKNTYVAYQTNKNGWSKISPGEIRVKPHPAPVAACINTVVHHHLNKSFTPLVSHSHPDVHNGFQ